MSTDALGKYEVLGKLAETATADLFVARSASEGTPQRFVVLKRLRREVAGDAERSRAFLSRARLVARIEHNNVAQVFEVGKLGSSYFCTIEYVDGEPVRAIIEHARGKKIPIPVRVVLAIAAGTAMGVRHAHELGIVHGNVTPTSAMVSRDGVVKLVGFAITTDRDRADDLRGLGMLLWELLTLQPVPEGDAPPPAPSSKRLDVPKELDAIVGKLLANEYGHASDVLAEIEVLAGKLDIAISTSDLARAMRLWFADATTGVGEEIKPIVVEAQAAPADGGGDLAAVEPVDAALHEFRANAAAIRRAVAAAQQQPSTRRKAVSSGMMPSATDERESFEQIRNRIMANARPKPMVVDASEPSRKKSKTLDPTVNQYSYITAVKGKGSAPVKPAAAPPPNDTDRMGPGELAELEARARADALAADEAKVAEAKAAEAKAAESAEAKAAEPKAAEPKAAEVKVADTPVAEPKAAEAKPAGPGEVEAKRKTAAEAKAYAEKVTAAAEKVRTDAAKKVVADAERAKADAKAKAEAQAEAKLAYADDLGESERPRWLVPAVGGGVAVAVVIVLLVVMRGGGKAASPPPPAPPKPIAVIADAAPQVAIAPAPDAAEAPPPAPPDAAEVAAAPPDAAQVAATHHHHDVVPPTGSATPKPPKPEDDKRSIEELFTAGEFAKTNKACATSSRFNSTILLDCGMSACTVHDEGLAKRWMNALTGQPRADVVAKCKDAGIDLAPAAPAPTPPAPDPTPPATPPAPAPAEPAPPG